MNISVFGLGKLGAPIAALAAAKGHTVIGVDLNPEFVWLINEGKATVAEPGLQEAITAGRDRLSATTDGETAAVETDVSILIVPTPSDEAGAFSNRYLVKALQSIGHGLRRKDSYHMVAVTSTVMPGSTGGELAAVLETASGRRVGARLGLCYSPEFIALGSVLRDLSRPDMVLIGESDARAGDVLAALLTSLHENEPSIRRMNFVNAELTKIAVNTFVTTKISYANMLGGICERLPGADVDVVTDALGCDSRIGRKYLKAATGYGGPCFPRDNRAFAMVARQAGAPADLAVATDAINAHQVDRLCQLIAGLVPADATIGVLGLAYKPDTDVVEESCGLALAHRLAEKGHRVLVHDPAARERALALYGSMLEATPTAAACAEAADLMVITTAWDDYRTLPLGAVRRPANRPPVMIVDCWNLLAGTRIADEATVIRPGRSVMGATTPEPTANAVGQ